MDKHALIVKEGDIFVLNVKVYGIFEVKYMSESLDLLIKFYENNKRMFEMGE